MPSNILDSKTKCGASEYSKDVGIVNFSKTEQRLQAVESPVTYDIENRPDPTTVPIGTIIFNTDTNRPNWSNGTEWLDF